MNEIETGILEVSSNYIGHKDTNQGSEPLLARSFRNAGGMATLPCCFQSPHSFRVTMTEPISFPLCSKYLMRIDAPAVSKAGVD